MNAETCRSVARTMNDHELFCVVGALNSEITANMLSGSHSTHAHAGMVEIACACSDELVSRGYIRGAKVDGSGLPRDVMVEDGIRYSIAVRVF